MSRRIRMKIDRRTGQVTREEADVPDAELHERLKSLITDTESSLKDDVLDRVAVVVCDGCGRREGLDVDAPRLPPGWTSSTGDGELCERCVRRRAS